MREHKFALGQTVRFTPGVMENRAPQGMYEIVRHLPAENNNNQYRIKSKVDGHERVVKENQIS